MVEFSESNEWTEFQADVVDVIYEPPKDEEFPPQYHIMMKPIDKQMKKEGAVMHEWIRITGTATEDSVPMGSVIQRYIEALHDLHGKSIKELSVPKTFAFMKGRKYLFKRKILGKAFEGSPASQYWVPVKVL